jgi:hypothetical protein
MKPSRTSIQKKNIIKKKEHKITKQKPKRKLPHKKVEPPRLQFSNLQNAKKEIIQITNMKSMNTTTM